MDKLRLGLPKGSLERATIDLFRRAGWHIQVNGRSYFPDIDDPEITCSMCRAQEMSRYVENGTLDCGLTGKDWIMENDSRVVVAADLVYSKTSTRPVRWVLAVPSDSGIKSLKDMAGKKITKDTTIAEVLKQKPKAAAILFSYGMPCLGCSVALKESVEAAAAVHGIDLDELLKKLNEESGGVEQ